LKNVIVYSFHFESGDPNFSPHYGQMRHSIYTLRKHNKSIPIKVFISPADAYSKMSIDLYDAEIIPFNATTDTLLDDKVMATRIKHRWPNVFRVLEEGYDNVLSVDQDTFWQGDVQIIFDKYSNSPVMYSKKDSWEEFSNFLPLTTPTMNEGIIMISSNVLSYKDKLLQEVENTRLSWQEMLRPVLGKNEHLWVSGVQWASHQYAISEFLSSIGKPFAEFHKMDVSMIQEYRNLSHKDKKEVIGVHYLSQNYKDFVPSKFLKYWRPESA
jgi:hypothetical protein